MNLSKHDEAILNEAISCIRQTVKKANAPIAVTKRLVAEVMKYRNRGRTQAIRNYPFKDICEASGYTLERRDAVLDELEPEKGYYGKIRWVCPKANNSGKRSCGKC